MMYCRTENNSEYGSADSEEIAQIIQIQAWYKTSKLSGCNLHIMEIVI